jgi:Nickel responsive protein SCO4226-like
LSGTFQKLAQFECEQLRGAAAKSNEVLHQLGPDIQWVESYVADKQGVHLAKDETIIRKHAEISRRRRLLQQER